MPRYRPPKWRERNAARELFPLELSDVEIARRVGVSARSVGRWRRAWLAGADPYAHLSSFGAIADQLARLDVSPRRYEPSAMTRRSEAAKATANPQKHGCGSPSTVSPDVIHLGQGGT